SVFILLPDPSGQTGQITVSNQGGTQTLDQPRQASRVRSAGDAPSPPVSLEEPEIRRLVGEALEAQPPEPDRFILYFARNSDELLPDSLAQLADVFRSIQERRSTDVTVAGHTDTIGDRAYNHRLGLRRAVKVADQLVSRGLDRRILDVSSHGEDDPLVKTGDEVPEPRNRRVEITVR
ncbi:MAG: OmpA family protein, partial [Candidatus Rokuibacteriota bacterium]